MSHLIKVYIVCKFSYFRLWYLNRVKFQKDGGQCNAIAPDSADYLNSVHSGSPGSSVG